MTLTKPPRMAFYSHDTMGLGHIRRNMLLANTLLASQPDLEVLLINGVRESGAFYFPKGMDSVTLPTYLKTPEGKYLPRSLGGDIHHLVALRAGIIRAALDAFNPDIVVVDNVPRGAMAELNAVLPLLKRKNARLILGLRDIIDEPERVLQQWEKLDNAAAIRDYYSDIWVYGDARFYDLTKAYKLDASIRKKVSFMGYLDATTQPQRPPEMDRSPVDIDSPYALCTVGGGQDGYKLANVFAQATFPPGVTGVLITGTMMPPAEYEALQKIAARRPDLHIIRFVANPLVLLQKAHSVIAMGGYNTTIEILSLHKRALIIPRVSPRKEQWIRASRLADIHLVSCIHPEAFTVQKLNAWLASDWQPDNPRRCLNLDGLKTFAKKIGALLPHKDKQLDYIA
ncbi:glycosyl transferase family 28 [Erwinia sp. HR93]|uniref:glycosyltransferase family protein n=1 Tax=Erwinia sp. HR93 TaxID=3094840 RepID=UPI002ADEBAF1|nr:glycosyl transferase family 28 [Erwinia sp. HR93]MEA1063765.1 glycosyl transferase family 28 [Erwinia sp. HR93]